MKPTKKPKTTQIHIYCSEEVHAKAMALAAASDDRSMAYVVVKLIEEAYDDLVLDIKYNPKR